MARTRFSGQWGRAITPRRGRQIAAGVHPFAPWMPPPAPTGSYDPALNAQLGQVNRGYGDLQQDTETSNLRDTVDYGFQQGQIGQQRDRAVSDIDRNLGLLHRSYAQLAGRQTEQGNAAGVLRGGALLQAVAKRAANEAVDRQPLDTARARTLEDSNTQLERLALEMAPASADNPLGGRRFQDRTTALTRAGRENTQFGLDIGEQKMFQATQAGYVPPGRGDPGGLPRNEHISPEGVHTRTVRVGNEIITVDSSGKVISRRRRGQSAQRRPGQGFGAGARF